MASECSRIQNKVSIGRNKEILANDSQSLIIVDEFEVASERDAFFDLPYLI
jgi:hypothetical protein